MQTESFYEFGFKNTCRGCSLQFNDLNTLFGSQKSDQLSLSDILSTCFRLKIRQDDGLPDRICMECTNQLINAYNFKIKWEESEIFLLNCVVRNKQNTSESNFKIKVEIEDVKYQAEIINSTNEKTTNLNIATLENDIGDANDSFQEDDFKIENNGELLLLPPLRLCEIIECNICNLTFSDRNSLINHSKTHTEKNMNLIAEEIQRDFRYEVSPNNTDFAHTEYGNGFESKLCSRLPQSTDQTLSPTRQRNRKKNNEIKVAKELNEAFYMPNGQKHIKCKICTAEFCKIYKLKSHMSTHMRLSSFDKVNYESDFLKSLNLNNNEIVEYIVKAIKQNNISKFYSVLNKAGYELSVSDSETDSDTDEVGSIMHRLYVCEICRKTFDRRYKMFYHQKSNHNYEELPLECRFCTMKFCCAQLLQHHLKSQCENLEKQHYCDQCNIKFIWRENLIQHKMQHELRSKKVKKKLAPKEKNFSCKICNKLFFRQEHLDRHENIHQPAEKKFECIKCNKKFNRKDNMKSHMRIHREDRDKDGADKHLCVYCGRSFSNSSNLIVHMRRHTGDKPYKCDMCDKGFPRSSDLQCHRRTHTGEKPCLCTVCGKSFSRSNKLVRHMRIHTGVRPYKCTYCERAFTQSNDLTLHIRRHTGDKPYVCGICGDRFIQGTALQTHRRIKGHYEEANKEAPYSSISVNNPNRLNFANRVDRIGLPKTQPSRPLQIKPVGRGNCPVPLLQTNSTGSVNSVEQSSESSINVITANETIKGLSSFPQSNQPPQVSSSTYISTNVPFTQEENELFSIANLSYSQPFH